MTTVDLTRRLSAILSADVEGYSRLMQDDEEATVRTITTYRRAITHIIEQYRGRVVDSPGDNILAEFTSVVDAVNCGVEIQRELAERNTQLPEKRQMKFRIGINLGDVLEEGKRIYGDGVNIAARMEGLSEAGGISISGTVYDAIQSKIGLVYESQGEHKVKNIDKPVRAYRVLSHPGDAAHRVVKAKRAVSAKWRNISLVAAAILVVVVAVGIWQFLLRPLGSTSEKGDLKKTAVQLPKKTSIAVLPFTNMSGDPKQEYFSDGITEDIITNLSKLSGLFVTSRNSSFLYRGKQVRIQDIAKDLGVHYVLEGSIQRAGDRVRVTAQLIDGNTEEHVWADSYDREVKDIFAVQDEVTRNVVSELAVALTTNDSERLIRKYTENFEAYDMYLRALREADVLKKETQLKALEMSQRVIDLDPKFAGGYQLQSFLLSRNIRFGFSASPKEDLEKAFKLAQKAVSVDEKFPASYMALASVYLMQGKQDDALRAANRAANLVPGDSDTILFYGYYLHWAGRGQEAVEAVRKSMELNPMYLRGRFPGYLDFMGFACFTAGLYDEAIEAMKKAIDRYGYAVPRYPFLIASYVSLGKEEEAKEAVQQLLRINPNFSLSSWKYGRNYKNPEDIERLYGALQKAGLK
jgi:adenylate cyclase